MAGKPSARGKGSASPARGGGGKSKNSRSVAVAPGAVVEQGVFIRFVALGAGWCYFKHPDGRTLHRKVSDPSLAADIAAVWPAIAARAGAELEDLHSRYPQTGWGALLETLTVAADSSD